MRTVLSADVVPGLHDHSFRGMLQGGKVLSKPRERVLAGYRQQCDQVAAGIRAVIRRATRERSHMIIEGTHIIPPFSRYLPPGTDAISAGLVLAVLDEDKHKSRFPRRAKTQSTRERQHLPGGLSVGPVDSRRPARRGGRDECGGGGQR